MRKERVYRKAKGSVLCIVFDIPRTVAFLFAQIAELISVANDTVIANAIHVGMIVKAMDSTASGRVSLTKFGPQMALTCRAASSYVSEMS